MSKKNEVVVSETTTLVAQEYVASDWGDVTVESKDLVLPKLLVQQSMSEAVKQKTAEEGDIVNTLTGENLGKEVELIPFYKTESIVIEKYNGRKFEYFKTIPYDGKSRPFEEDVDGVRYKNSHQYLIYALMGAQGMPHVLSFKGTSNKVGRQLVSLMYVSNLAEKLTPAGKAIKFSGKTETSKSGDMYQVSSFIPTRRTTPEEVQEALKWIKVLRTTSTTIAEEVQSSVETSTEHRF